MKLSELRDQTLNPDTGKSYTGAELAEKIGVSVNTYFRWEWGQSVPSGRNLVKLESLLPGSTHTLVNVERESA